MILFILVDIFKLAALFGIVWLLTKKLKVPIRISIFSIIIMFLVVRYCVVNVMPEHKPYHAVEGKVVFESDRVRKDSYDSIFLIENKKINKLIRGRVPSFSPDGTKVAFVGHDRLSIFDFKTNSLKKNENNLEPQFIKPVWSYNGRYIYFVYGTLEKDGSVCTIYRYDMILEQTIKIINFEKRTDIHSIQNYKDEKIFILTSRPIEGSEIINELLQLDLRNNSIIKLNTKNEIKDFAISHDFKKIVFTSYYDQDGTRIKYTEVFTMDIDGTNIKRLTRNKWQEANPIFSPDDKQICFTSMRYYTHIGGGELYVISTDGTNERRITPIKRIGGLTLWSTDQNPDWHE